MRGNSIFAYYGDPANEVEVCFGRSELVEALQAIYSICEAVSVARTLFVIDNMQKISRYLPEDLAIRGDASVLSLATAVSTQGFHLADLQIRDDSVAATVEGFSNCQTSSTLSVE